MVNYSQNIARFKFIWATYHVLELTKCISFIAGQRKINKMFDD